MTLTNVASKLMHVSSFTARFNKGCAHHAGIVRVPQDCEALRSSPPILPPVMIILSRVPGGAALAIPRRSSSQECR